MGKINQAKDLVVRIIQDWAKQRIIKDYDEYCTSKPSRRALLSYLVLPLLPPRRFRDRVMFSNRGIAQEIPRVLNELGYSVDIVNYDNCSWLPDQKYDLFIGHGGINFERISRQLPESTIRVYFATGIYWKCWNRNNYKRSVDFVHRKRVELHSYRAVAYDEEYALGHSKGIICLGNDNAVNSYRGFPLVIGINNALFPTSWEGWRDKDFEEGRKHFLFFSGRGNVHKGLDLLLEAFSKMPLHLHICQYLEDDFADVYKKELTGCPNIHIHGFTSMRSRQFYSLAKKCDWVISPTCAEGQPGALLECMAHGLIPILSKDANIDCGGMGISLSDCDIGTLRSEALRACAMGADSIRRMATVLVVETRKNYSVDNFRRNLSQAIHRIIK